MKKIFLIVCIGCWHSLFLQAQKMMQYDLAALLRKNQLVMDTSNHAQLLQDAVYKNAISFQKILWLKDLSFKEGTIDVDLRGKNSFLQSFLGIAFHASDHEHYEVVYFRPFNFQYPDTARRRWSLQYMVTPDFPWDRLRKSHPFIYENSITPPPKPDEWFHATIVVKDEWISVYVNHAAKPSLQVKKIGTMNKGSVGLWADGLSGDFANLTIKTK